LTLAVAYVLALLVLALFLFAKDYLPIDVTSLIVLLLLVLPPGLLTPEEALAGFGSETIVILISLFVLTAGVTRTGVVERIGMRVAALGRKRPGLLSRLLLVACTTISGVLSNTVTTAVFLPLMIGSARRARIPVGKLLMPLAFASILSGGVTVISTSTNLVVSGEMRRHGLEPIGFFEMAPAGIVITVVGMIYLLFIAPRLIPDRTGTGVIERYNLRKYISEAEVTPGSSLAGKTLGETRLEAMDLIVLGIRRTETKILAPRQSTLLREGDVLLVEGRAEDILSIKDTAGLVIRPDFKLSDPDLVSEKVRMVEAMVRPRSNLIGRTLSEALFRERTGLTVLAIHSGETTRRTALAKLQLDAGDVLLLQGSAEAFERVDEQDLLLLEDKSAHHPRSAKSRIALLVFVACIVLAATKALPMSIAFLLGVPVLILTRCLSTEEAYESVDWRLMVMIGSMMAFGVAMQKTGAAAWLAELIVRFLSGWGPHAILVGFFLLTVILTQPMSNQAAALVLLPVAMQVADTMQIEPRSLVMCVTFAASCSFMTPLEPSCILVWGPGRYRFLDFVKVGGILTVIVFLTSITLIPYFWPLTP
jgi:di/tricarboxylate transporter